MKCFMWTGPQRNEIYLPYVPGRGRSVTSVNLFFFVLYVYGDVSDTPGIVSGQKALFGSPLGETAQLKVKDRKREVERENVPT